MGIGPDAPYGRPYAPWAWRTHKVASPVTSHIHRSEGSLQACRRRTDQSLAPTFLADEQAPHTTEAQA
jgi:hypothetical protein